MITSAKTRRLTYKWANPNPLFEQWLLEWKTEAINKNHKLKFSLSKALESLKKFPLPLETGKDCAILEGFGNTICSMLDKKLVEHEISNSKNLNETIAYIPEKTNTDLTRTAELHYKHNNVLHIDCFSEISSVSQKELNNADRFLTDKQNKSKNKKINCKTCTPAERSNANDMIVLMFKHKNNLDYFMTKDELHRIAQVLCRKSLNAEKSGPRCKPWTIIKMLINEKLVASVGDPAQFCLTNEGIDLAKKLLVNNSYDEGYFGNLPRSIIQKESLILEDKVLASKSSVAEKRNNSKQYEWMEENTTGNKILHENEEVVFSPSCFDIILLVDTQETSGTAKKAYDATLQELTRSQVQFEVRHLNIGDFMWVCRAKSGKEMVLPYIVERKRMDDFGSSIKDGRFHEQKFRLKQSGIQNLIYLVESYGNNQHSGLPISTLLQAATNTQIQDEFTVKFTTTHHDSMKYLALLTNILQRKYMNKTLTSCSKDNMQAISLEDDLIYLMEYNEFNKAASKLKNYKVNELFMKHLLQLKGISIDKALAIVHHFPTPKTLSDAYASCSVTGGEKLLSNIQYGPLNKNIGPNISKILYQLFTFQK